MRSKRIVWYQKSMRIRAVAVACGLSFCGFLGGQETSWGQGLSWGQTQPLQNPVYHQQGAYRPSGIKIPGHLMGQATEYWQQVAYQPQLGQVVEPVETAGVEYVPSTTYEQGFVGDGEGLVRVWGAGVDPRLITVQRYDDHYWDFRVDLISYYRDSINAPTADWAGDTHKTGGVRASIIADLLYSFDLEFGFLGALYWHGLTTSSWAILPNPALTDFTSSFNAYEINTKWRWVGTVRPCTGAWILGVRYVNFEEKALAVTQRDLCKTKNDAVGFQAGGELFWAVVPGVMIGGDLKAGIYGNYGRYEYSGPTPSTPSSQRGNNGAFLGEANLMVNAALPWGWYIRGGYTGLFMTNVSMVSNVLGRTSGLSVPLTSTLIAHGFYGGLEWQY